VNRGWLILLCASVALLNAVVSASADVDSTKEAIAEPPITSKERDHWAFRPLARPKVPAVAQSSQVANPIDAFVLARLERRNLTLMPRADRRTLIRRLSFDLTGLPPTPGEVETFLADPSDRAYEDLIDRLLASPAYGERWAQHWLDVARFAETDGFEHDKIRPEAWRYRDWVIRAFNEDIPYDRFLQMQIAGDELFPDDPGAVLATGFLLSGPDMPDINDQEERRHTVLNEITSTVGASILGLGLRCAQCHDHKYDPVSQADFYRTRAFFENTIHTKRDKQLGHVVREPGPVPPTSHLMIRGDFRRPGPELLPAYLRIANVDDAPFLETSHVGDRESSGRRSAFAKWLTRPDHPLTLRVIVNRLWQHHFGEPLVGTPNDFGFQGDRPTHPLLLDWLATEMPSRGWSFKSMHRLILTSATYQQMSFGSGEPWERARRADPQNRLWSRMNRQRLTGEAIRDAMLSIGGMLNRESGGPGVRPPLSEEITVTLLKNQWQVSTNEADHYRRSIYLFARRNMRYPMFDVFDRPDANASCARRHESTTAPQSLTLLNSGFSLETARRLAGRSFLETGPRMEDRIRTCYRLALGRPPVSDELTQSLRFIEAQARALESSSRTPDTLAFPIPAVTDSDPFRESALVDFCLALFNLSEFVYID
jgi:hypothetical protein